MGSKHVKGSPHFTRSKYSVSKHKEGWQSLRVAKEEIRGGRFEAGKFLTLRNPTM